MPGLHSKGGAYIRKGICVSKSIGLASSWEEIYYIYYILYYVNSVFNIRIQEYLPGLHSKGGAYIRKGICVSKSIGLASSWEEIYVSNLQQVFTETRLEDVNLSKTQPCKCFVYIDRGNPLQD